MVGPCEAVPDLGGNVRLRRVLTLPDLILYGVICMSPVAPMPFFGILNERGGGHAATTILIAMFAMSLTALSYGRMARAYPTAGSAFIFVGKEFNAGMGYMTGWAMMMDYLLNPLICIVWCSQQGHVFLPGLPYWAWAAFFAVTLTVLNVQGVKVSARVVSVMVACMGLVIATFLVASVHYVYAHHHGGTAWDYYTRPFYDPQTWAPRRIMSASSLAVLTYLGFDAISTLSEEANNPRANILKASVLSCFAIGVLSAIEVYAAQLVWPISRPYPNLDTAFTFVAGRVWAPLFVVVGLTQIVATFGAGLGAQLGAARLLYGMGRSGALPRGYFGAINVKKRIPQNNVVFLGAVALAGALILPHIAREKGMTPYELGANLLNFGALLTFMGVNAAAFMRYFVHQEIKRVSNFILPSVGFLVCLLLWWNLKLEARIFGICWMVVGLAFGAWRTQGFRRSVIALEVPPEC